ncbi:ankyrin repeat domain-containing protein [Candidatus Tisiphia endosymbiont of Oplodontha viridula]|uniref:ankyrin repeat domain-containing protein n=1 Tax=Candidatus Tisiphia endosymbiont of Oplodontha viridula TaxID=3077925 RepID=UPI0035C88893
MIQVTSTRLESNHRYFQSGLKRHTIEKFILHNGQEKIVHDHVTTTYGKSNNIKPHYKDVYVYGLQMFKNDEEIPEQFINDPGVHWEEAKTVTTSANWSEAKIFWPLNNALNNIASILDIIPQITSYQSSNSSYATQSSQKTQELAQTNQENSQKSQEVSRKNQEVSQKSQEIAWKNQEVSQKNQEIAQKNREITEVQKKIAGLQSQENSLQSQINSFQISNNIKTLNAKQKAHILQKLWGNGDAESVSVINAIKQYGFDPHYVHKNGQSLTQLALSRNDVALFDLLIANKIDFNISSANLTIFKLVLNSGNSNFISKMFATGQDFTKSLLDVVLQDDAVMLGKIFSHKAELSQVSYSGYSLLQLALKNGCYKAAEQILQSNPQSINQLTTKGISALQLAMLTDDKLGIELLKKFGANFELELKNAISKDYGKSVTKILETNPELLNKLEAKDNSPLYHALLQNKLAIADALLNKGADSKIVMQKALAENNLQMIKDLVALNADSVQLVINDNKTVLYLALEQDKTEIAKLLLKTSDLMSVVKLSADKVQANIAVKLIKLESSLLGNLAQIENSKVTEKLLESPEFMSLAESLTDSNGNNLLHLACQNNNYQLATRILEKAHINVNQQNNEGKTAFHILLESSASFAEKSQLAEVLLKHHPDINLSDTSGHTSIDLAVEHDAGILAMFYQQNLMGDSTHHTEFN